MPGRPQGFGCLLKPHGASMKHIGYLAIVPVLGLLLGPVIHNSSTPFILGMPFLLGWMVIWVVLVSIVMAIIYALDPARQAARVGRVRR